MATFKFTNVSNERETVKGTYDAPVNPTLSYVEGAAAEAYVNAKEDFAVAAGDVKVPVYDLGVHSMAVVHPGETFIANVEDTDAAAIAFYTELACQLEKSDCVKVEVEGVEPHTPESI